MKNELDEKKNKILQLLNDDLYVPMKEKELVVLMQVSSADRPTFKQCLEELLAEGKISVSKRGKYTLPDHNLLTGTFTSTQNGYGFVSVDGMDDDFYIAEKDVNTAMHMDKVLIDPYNVIHSHRRGHFTGARREAVVVQVLERATDIVVGTYDAAKHNYGFVIPDNNRITQDVFVPVEHSKGAVSGHKVVVKLTNYGSAHKSPEGKVIEILGHEGDPGVDILSIIRGYDLPTDFPDKVLSQAERVPDALIDTDYNAREDYRTWDMVTIDGPDSKDLDDAVSLYMDGENYVLGVHIADVTHYVKENSALDREALKRGTSVYLTDRVIPMLPHRLCNGICSLNEGEDRLALSCVMTINSKGDIIDHRIVESVIKTNHRMIYDDVDVILKTYERIKEECKSCATNVVDITSYIGANSVKYGSETVDIFKMNEDVVPMLIKMGELANLLREKRKKRGSIDFDLPETKIIVDKNGHPTEVKPYDRNAATKLIEDFMLAANETVAEHFFWAEIPFVYRTHENPDLDKLRKLQTFIRNFGYGIKIKDEEVHPKELQKLLANVSDTPEEALISRLTLRSMQRAKYTTTADGHYGLACKYYCHFTSPIRRYPDLQIHRIIKECIKNKGRLKEDRLEHYEKILPEVAKESSSRERIAEEAEREVDKLKKAEYMGDHIGEIYEGIISGITNWGIYVELPNTVEGLVHISKIQGDYFVYKEDTYELVGEATGRRFCLGQKITVCVNSVDYTLRAVDFILADDVSLLEYDR